MIEERDMLKTKDDFITAAQVIAIFSCATGILIGYAIAKTLG